MRSASLKGWEAAKLRQELLAKLAGAAVYALVAAGFYLFSLVAPGLFAGIRVPGLPEPLSDLDQLVRALLFLSSLAFAFTALFEALQAIDPFFEMLAARIHGDVGPAKRLARDLALMLLVALALSAAGYVLPLAEPLGAPLRILIGSAALAALVLFLYDIARTVHKSVRRAVERFLINPGVGAK